MNKEELKFCPFCGCEAELVQEPLFGSDSMTKYYRIECTNRDCEMGKPDCLYDVSELDKSEIIKAWNTRTPTDEGKPLPDPPKC